MNPPLLFALALGAIAAVAMVRMALTATRRGDRPWRRGLLVAGQAALAALLWSVLAPPAQPGRPVTLALLTEGAEAAAVESAPDTMLLALPGAPDVDGAMPVPDLGTALRRHPGAALVRVHGLGLAARDRDAAQCVPLAFAPAPLPATLVALSLPDAAVRGRRFSVHGRIIGHAGGTVDLLDPAGVRIDRAALDDAGAFVLAGVAGPAGRADYRLQWRRAEPGMDAASTPADASPPVAEGLALPLRVVEGAPLRVLVIAGGANPELKYLRRWALDAGLALSTQLRLGGGVLLGDDRQPLTLARLAELDLVVLDERAWRTLGRAGQATLREAVRDGLGLLLRLTADPTDAERRELADWGFTVTPVDVPRSLRLPGTERADPTLPGADDAEVRATDAAPLLSRRPLALAAADGRPLLTSEAGDALALWRPEGRGRVALWTLSDSFQLALAGRQAAYGSLWSATVGELARARAGAALPVPARAWVGERSALCGLGEDTVLLDPAGDPLALVRDPATGERACAAFWPTRPGWHLRRDGEREHAFLVRDPAEAPGLHAADRQDATRALVEAAPADAQATPQPVPGPRWPWALAWLLLAGGLWWLERSRRGRG